MVEDNTSSTGPSLPAWFAWGRGVRLGGGRVVEELQEGGRENKGGGKRREDLDTKSRNEISP